MSSQDLSPVLGLTMERVQHSRDARLVWPDLWLWHVALVMSLVALSGCGAAYHPPVLTTLHPAHPEAVATPDLPPSKTLAYTAADIPSTRSPVDTTARPTPGASSSAQDISQTVVGEGKIIAVEPSSEELVVKHGDIQGFMGPMTMGYKVNPPSLLNRLETGDSVRFTIDTKQKAIVKVERLKP
jgi:Cu/Ag efflux protein CusF